MVSIPFESNPEFKVTEIFRSIQGEGIYQGRPTIFVRFSGCNLRCSWCDTRYAFEEGNSITLEDLMEAINDLHLRNVCLTGGEPLLQEHLPLLARSILESGCSVDLETNGTLPVSDFLTNAAPKDPSLKWRRRIVISLDVKMPSSGEAASFLRENLDILTPLDQIKFVVAGQGDMDYAKEFITRNAINSPVVIQPLDVADTRKITEMFLEICWPREMDARLILQSHKIIWGKDTRGV